jgi:hypothetical protein
MNKYFKEFTKFKRQFLLIKLVRIIACKIRFFYFVKILHRVKTIESKEAINHTVPHNLKSLGAFGLSRMELIIKPVSVIENVSKNSKVLVIGPRNEDDILYLIGNGFNPKNLIGLDLITYSPYIKLGDMHDMPFNDSIFDLVICGWTLSYSETPEKFANEVLRVIKDSGTIAIGVEYSTLSDELSVKHHGGYTLKPKYFERINSTKEILNLFSNHVKMIYFNHDAPNKISHGNTLREDVSSVVTIFSITK